MQSILLVPVPPAPMESLGFLRRALSDIFRLPVEIENVRIPNSDTAFDSSRNQYFSSILLSLLLEHLSAHNGKILAVTSSDLFIPVLTFVFGEAQLDGRAAIVSSHRLDEEFYGLPANPTLFQERLLKEAVHELGHTFGLIHCGDYNCVMHSSTAVEEIDVKGRAFCRGCVEKLTVAFDTA